MINRRASESGQVLVILMLGIIVLLAFTALAIDGGRIYLERSRAQNTADASALAAAYAKTQGQELVNAALDLAYQNGFDNDGTTNTVTVNNPPSEAQYGGSTDYIEVIINSTIESGFAHFVFSGPLQTTVRAVTYVEPGLPCGGYAVFADRPDGNPNTLKFTGGENWVIGGGMHSNSGIHLGNFTADTPPIEYDVGNQSNLSNYTGPPLTQVAPFPMQQLYSLADFQPPNGQYWLQACAAGLCFQGNSLNDISSDGLYYVDGNVDVNNIDTSYAITVVATGDIRFSARNNAGVNMTPYIAGLFVFSLQGEPGPPAIRLGGDETTVYDGNVYAPNGVIKMASGSWHEVHGAVFGWEVDLSGGGNRIEYQVQYCPLAPDRISLYE
ncbi:MAG: pilus assembly protein TadG-related protein [Anaerolineales bacterium]